MKLPGAIPNSLSLALLMMLAGCRSLPPSKALSQLTTEEASGRQVFLNHCAQCHYPDKDTSLRGPGLQALYKKPYLPSGAPANDDRVTVTILHGRNNMPALGNTLDDLELRNLLAYLHTL